MEQIIQIIGWAEIATLFALLPFERKYGYLEKAERFIPSNPLASALVGIIIGIPIMWSGIFVCLLFFVWVFFFWLVAG